MQNFKDHLLKHHRMASASLPFRDLDPTTNATIVAQAEEGATTTQFIILDEETAAAINVSAAAAGQHTEVYEIVEEI